MERTLEALDNEWRRIAASDEARRALPGWAKAYPALGGASDVSDLLRRRRDPREAGRILAALAYLAPTDALAARALLQALLPGLVCLAATAGPDDADAIEEVIALAWERIRTYPPTRAGSVAANVLWDVRKQYRIHRRIDVPSEHGFGRPSPTDVEPSAEDIVVRRAVCDEIVRALCAGAVSRSALRLIVRTRIEGESLTAVAAEQNVNPHALNQRRWRAERRLRPRLARGIASEMLSEVRCAGRP